MAETQDPNGTASRSSGPEQLRVLQAIFDNSEMGFGVFSLEGRLLQSNPSLRRILGYGEDEIPELSIRSLSTEEDRALVEPLMQELLAGKLDRYRVRSRVVGKNGILRHCDVVSTLVRNEQGLPEKYVQMYYDISHVEVAEGSLQVAHSQFSRLLERESRAHSELKRATQLRDEILVVVSDELMAPLSPLKLQIQFLKELLPELVETSLSKELVQILGMSELLLSKMECNIEHHLGRARPPLHRTPLSLSSFDLSELLKEVVEQYCTKINQARCLVKCEALPGLIGNWDRAAISQVIATLLKNALHYGAGKPIQAEAFKSGE